MIDLLALAAAAAAAVSPAPSPAPSPSQAAPAAAERRYCVVDTVTGSRIRQRDCRTRAEWLRDGFDPLARN